MALCNTYFTFTTDAYRIILYTDMHRNIKCILEIFVYKTLYMKNSNSDKFVKPIIYFEHNFWRFFFNPINGKNTLINKDVYHQLKMMYKEFREMIISRNLHLRQYERSLIDNQIYTYSHSEAILSKIKPPNN